MIELKLEDSVIKGYHHFQIKPPLNTLLKVDLEYTNIHDEDASLVWIPQIDDFPSSMHGQVTDPQRFLKLSDIAGLPIGHVPRGLAGTFRAIIESGGSVSAIAKGEPCQSFPPWPSVHDVGGGAVIPCDYVIKSENQNHVDLLKNALSAMPEKDAMSLIV